MSNLAKSKIQVALVDDHQLFRSGINFIISDTEDIEVAFEASNGQEFLNFLSQYQPDVVLMDINMPVMDGVEATRRGIEQFPDLKVLVLSMFGEVDYYNTMIDIGVKGFILKDIDNDELLEAIRKVNKGGSYFSQELLLQLIKNKPTDDQIELTRREKEVLELICLGYSNQEISEKLFISQRTVERHRSSLLFKTNSKNSVSLVVYAIKNGLVKI
ncbi:MAG: response regulator transcription factor [Bacteroidales bacterium]|nr:response regulator transcription factor [Bacteroidales bacterium]MBN2820613.1 response regulator transcription factor [Bacteroidales bacterium]